MRTLRNFKRWSVPTFLGASLCIPTSLLPATRAQEVELRMPAISPALSAQISALAEEIAKPAVAVVKEVIDERYPSGKVKISREVVQDETGNYLNDGFWKMYSEQGTLLIEGNYERDARTGVWNRWYAVNDLPMFRERPFNEFAAPFISQGQFSKDRLNGAWIFYDAKHRKISEIHFASGERHGLAAWYYANGQKMREMHFEQGVLSGKVTEWKPDGSLAKVDVYEQGRRQAVQTAHHKGNVKKSEVKLLEPPLYAKTLDDWFKGALATYAPQGNPIKHGEYRTWHTNGQVSQQGEYQHDQPVGTFTWWFPNGQRSTVGGYEDGAQHGEWCWWHENGNRSIRGEYRHGAPIGAWTWWNPEGKVSQALNFSEREGTLVEQPSKKEEPRQAQFPRLVPSR